MVVLLLFSVTLSVALLDKHAAKCDVVTAQMLLVVLSLDMRILFLDCLCFTWLHIY